MPEQPLLPGLVPPPTDRLFFALFPDTPAREGAGRVAESLRGSCGLTARALPARRLHVTLHHVGDFAGLPVEMLARAQAAGDAVRHAAFPIRFDRAGSFLRRRRTLPLVLRGGGHVIPIIAFQHLLGEALRRQGFHPPSSYTPHMTLLYDARYVAARAVTAVEWTARDFVLVRSFIGRSKYEILGRWPLAA